MKKIFSYSITVIALLVIMGEVSMRLSGLHPFKEELINLEMEPEWMYEFDSTLGLKLKPGVYQISEMNSYNYIATIDSSGFRVNAGVTLKSSESAIKDSSSQIIFLGAGSTFGQGLNDTDAYVFALQKLLPEIKVRNQAVMGYGVANNYVQLMNLKNYKKGDLVIYIYHVDQDNRNRISNQKESLNIFSKNPHFQNFHFITIDSNLQTHLHKFDYGLWPLSKYSALINFLEDSYNESVDSRENYNAIARKAILAMNDRCLELGLEFWVVCWKSEELSLSTLDYLSLHGVRTFHIPISIGFGQIDDEQLVPANKAFADSLANRLKAEKFVSLN